MNRLKDKQIRTLLPKKFRDFRKKYPSKRNKLKLKDVENLYNIVVDRQTEANEKITNKLSNELWMAYLSTFQMSLLALNFTNKGKIKLLCKGILISMTFLRLIY